MWLVLDKLQVVYRQTDTTVTYSDLAESTAAAVLGLWIFGCVTEATLLTWELALSETRIEAGVDLQRKILVS